MKKANDEIRQAELILKLYDLRREAVMREARNYVGGEFQPKSAAEFVKIVSQGGKETGYVLQVYGYWDMVSAFVALGALTERLVYDTCQEMYFQYAKIQGYLKEFRELMNLPEFLCSIEKVIESSAKGRKRVAAMRANMERIQQVREQKDSSRLS